ncbi:sister chromatid cohesion 1 protein 4 isoform X2 [Ricinus communis]|uniref:sister chromatid cohesion 1 protein 4 isoform X2 n=1 Tax=Ricinus communis TaxID=3988 RepID=UPI00201A98AE|nr:sister chromatid cohesion 1 protein 4 isoform X2 [Ricinus communis]
MFYSQFILAKKGPLGTIWIAAHLERKLRKNQVADTDIGVSVDSILFPEVPIALRLSSHLLLGVVRIYSRKVNYLFDDCSEALLKIKQAFRSTAVDLPPEESTAPYHSITLPETFDLDDFELPDNDIFQGNYIDHHVSTREQITLQDTMDGAVYSTSQFGLDERFGDGDTSQVGLDLEEDLFLGKVAATGHDEISENDAQTSVELLEPSKTVASHERMTGTSEEMPLNGTRSKIEDLAANLEVIDYAQAPSTPGLMEEPNLSSVKDCLVCDDHLESEDHNVRGLGGMEISKNAPSKSALHHGDDARDLSLVDHLSHDTIAYMPTEEHSRLSGDLEINQAGLEGELLSTAVTSEHGPADETVSRQDESHQIEDKNKVVSSDNGETVTSIDQINGDYEESLAETNDNKFSNKIGECLLNGKVAPMPAHSSGLPTALETVNVEGQDGQGQEDSETLLDHVNNEQMKPTCISVLLPCNSHLSQPDILSGEADTSVLVSDLQSVDVAPLSSETVQREEGLHTSGTSTKVQGEECHVTDVVQSEENQISDPTLNGETQEDGGKHDVRLDNEISNNNQNENLTSPTTTELPAPEKLLSIPQTLLDKPHDLLVETPDKEVQEEGDGSGAGIRITGKKRSFAESALTVQSLNSVESFGVTRSKRTVESIPDDDDLLSSILVGRKSSALKMKPTPPAPEVPSMKRARFTSRPSALKRKVLMDDSMVLHGDIIRQQLTNTEDIRRLRKKAPCTRTEILMIQRQFLEDEIFSEPVLTGMSAYLTRMHSEAFDWSGIKVCENDDNNMASLEVVNDEHSARQIVKQDGGMEGSTEPVGCRTDIEEQTSEVSINKDNQQVEDHLGSYDIDNEHMNGVVDIVGHRTSVHEHLGETSEMENDKVNSEVSDAINHSAPGLETSQSEPASGDILEMPSATVDQSVILDKAIGTHEPMQVDTPIIPSDEIHNQLIEDVAGLRDMSNDIGLDCTEVVDNCAKKIGAVEAELRTGEELLLEESKVRASVEIGGDEQVDGSAPNDGADASLANVSSEAGSFVNFSSVNIDQAFEEIENYKHGVFSDNGGLGGNSMGIDDKDQTSDHLCSEEAKINSTYTIGLDGDFKNTSMNDGDNTVSQLVDQQDTMDTQNAPPDHVTTGECDDIRDVGFANDTEFLNVDDDEIDEDDNEGLPNAEDPRLLENSGWSSRTRAVAKYLQTLFDKEAEHGRKVLLMDNLLTGKTRKEASRMFFETLVLKTKDYVHVEQGKPFDNINIKPRAKLMKSDF